MNREQAKKWFQSHMTSDPMVNEAYDIAIEALSADAVSREEYEEVKAYMDTLVDAFIEDGEELAESVKVVRCEDCKWELICRQTVEQANVDAVEHRPLEWCSYGERNEL